MGHAIGRVREMRLGASGQTELSIACPRDSIPIPGQYLIAIDAQDEASILGAPLFMIDQSRQGFWAAPLHPVRWMPGTILELLGPYGRGFDLPANIQRLALVALGDSLARLLPLVYQAVRAEAGIALFTDLSLPALPSALEAHPLSALGGSLDWPDFLALDLPLDRLDGLRQVMSLPAGQILPCPAQALVTTPMPCAGLARCGACAVHGRRGWKLACEDGPVFDLRSLSW
jgi:hypothetical protein